MARPHGDSASPERDYPVVTLVREPRVREALGLAAKSERRWQLERVG